MAGPDRIAVYAFKVWDGFSDTYHYPEYKSTKERIDRVRGVILDDTAELVDISDLDADGRFMTPRSAT